MEKTNKNIKKSTTSKKSTTAKTKKPVVKNETVKPDKKVTVKTVEAKKQVPTKKVVDKKAKEIVEMSTAKPVIKETIKSKKNTVDFVKENAFIIMLCTVCLLLIVNIVIVVNGHKVKLSNGKEIVAEVDGLKITAEDLFEKLKTSYGTASIVAMIDEHIISNEKFDEEAVTKYAESQLSSIKSYYESQGSTWADILENYGYTSEDALVNEIKNSYRKELLVRDYLSDKLTDEEIKAYYDSNIYGDYNAKHILIKPDTTDSMTTEEKTAADTAAYNTALEVINRLNAKEDWAALVKEKSEDTGSVETEGLIENFTKGDVVDEFFTAVLNLKNGEYTTTPVKSTYGYHIILKVSNTDKPKFEDAKNNVIKALVDKKLTDDSALFDKTWLSIRESYKLEINDTVISNKYKELNS